MAEPNQVDLLHVRGLLDGALLGLRAIDDPELPLEGVRGFLSLALASVYEACRDGVDFPTFREQTTKALDFSREALAALQVVSVDDAAIDHELGVVARAIAALATEDLAGPVPGLRIPIGSARPPLLASVGEPRLHDPERRVLLPTIPLRETDRVKMPEVDPDALPASPVPPITNLAELLAYAERVKAEEAARAEPKPPAPPPAPSEEQLAEADPIGLAVRSLIGAPVPQAQILYARARGFFEDIATMSSMRKADGGDVWHLLEPVERRMLARVDAILASGPWLLPRLIQLLEDRPVPDPEMLWAAIFVLGCIQGDDTRDQIVRLVEITPLDDEEVFEAVADVLSVIPHRGVEGVMRRWLEHPEPHRVALAAHVLGRRRATMVETLLPLLGHEHPRVLEETARALEQVPGELREPDLRDVIRHADGGVFRAAAECAVVRGFRAGVIEAEYRLKRGDPAVDAAAILVALTSDEDALELLFSQAAVSPSLAVYEALGWLGSVTIVPFLLGRLRDGDVGAVRALQRLTGASLTDEDPIRTYDEKDRPFVRDHFLAPPREILLSEDADVWTAFWETYGGGAKEKRRYRFGHEWSSRDNLYELRDMPGTARTRRFAYLELCARCGGAFPFDPSSFVVPQRAQVERWAEYLGESHARAPHGLWTSRLTS